MASGSPKHAPVSVEEELPSVVTSVREDEKTIPFLRRLRDMLVENEDAISFSPGHRLHNGKTVLGRIVVHDRIVVESKVLPKYFNHSSFASLRRQLNYFSFVRLGKGRQRESIYINENVVELQDVLHLKRRSAGSSAPVPEQVAAKCSRSSGGGVDPPKPVSTTTTSTKETLSCSTSLNSVAAAVAAAQVSTVQLLSKNNNSKKNKTSGSFAAETSTSHRTKRRRLHKNSSSKSSKNKQQPAASAAVVPETRSLLTRSISPINHFVSEDETTTSSSSEQGKSPRYNIALDLTKPLPSPPRRSGSSNEQEDNDVEEMLAGCNALLKLATKVW